MHSVFKANFDILLERSPLLAGRVYNHFWYKKLDEVPFYDFELEKTSMATWLEEQIKNANKDRLNIIWGLGAYSLEFKERTNVNLWVIEPSMDIFFSFMLQYSIQNLCINGYVIVDEPCDTIVKYIMDQRCISILRAFSRNASSYNYFDNIEQKLQKVSEESIVKREQNNRLNLMKKIAKETDLESFFNEFPETSNWLPIEEIENHIARKQKAWSRIEKIFLTIGAFR